MKLRKSFGKIFWTLHVKRSKDDPEKLITPAILFVSANHPAFEEDRQNGFLLALGWWDFSIRLAIIFKGNEKETA